MDLLRAADEGISGLRARLIAEPPPGLSPAEVSSFFARHGAGLSNVLRFLLEAALVGIETLNKWRLSELESIQGTGGMSYQVTHVRLGKAQGFVREGLFGDRFMMTSNERLAMGRGESISKKLSQVLYLAAEPEDWNALAEAVRKVEISNAAANQTAPRPVLKHARWTVPRAHAAVQAELDRQAADRRRSLEPKTTWAPQLGADLRALLVAGRVATLPGPAVAYANAADLALQILNPDERRYYPKWRDAAAEAFRRWTQAQNTPLPTPLAAALVEFVALKSGDEKTIAEITEGFGLVPVGDEAPSSSQPKEVYDYQVAFTGIFGRNRTVKDHSVKLLRHVPRSEPKTIEELKPLMRDVLEEQRVRNDATVVVREYPLEITADGFEKHVIGTVRVLFRGSAKDIL